MATITVTTAADVVNAADGVLSLREAVQQANATTAADTIQFANVLEGQTLTLTQGQLTIADADPADRSETLTIDGDADDNGSRVTISGGNQSRVLEIQDGGYVGISGLVVSDGDVDSGSGAGILIGERCNVRVDTSQIRDCSAGGSGYEFSGSDLGGGIAVRAGSRLSLDECEINNNFANYGGGISIGGEASLSIQKSYVHDNSVWSYTGAESGFAFGGGIQNSGFADIRNSAITRNEAGFGGGLSGGTFRLTNTTITDNVASGANSESIGSFSGAGGGISFSDISLYSSTITNNTAEIGSGIAGSTIRIFDSIVAGNHSTNYSPDIGGTPAGDYSTYGSPEPLSFSNGHNIFDSFVHGSVPGDLQNVAADRLFAAIDPETGGGLLALNGGAVPTVALRNSLDNPALGGAAPLAEVTFDARGVARPAPATTNPDIGAFELNQTAVSTTASANNDVLTGSAANNTLGGLQGADLLLGLGGNDTLSGDDGSDTLRGGFGNDALNGGAGQDTASYRDATAAVIVSLAGNTSAGGLGADTLSGIESLEGGGGDTLTGDGLANGLGGLAGNDRLYGLTGNDRLYGGAGDDLLEGGFGDDWLDGGADIDTVSYVGDAYPLAVTINLTIGQVTRSGEVDRLQGIENADGTDNADTLFGDTLANRLGGAGGADTIKGLGGDDVLIGGLGNDSLDGDAGLDLADFTSGTSVAVDLSGAADRATRGAEVDTLLEIEGAIGSANADTFRGDALANLFRGQGGKDTATGGAGADDFDYDALAHSTVGAARDVITDFTPGVDDLDLSTLDARTATPAVNDAFTFLAARGAAFTGAGQVRWSQSAGTTLVEANLDANLAPDLQIQLTGLKTLTSGDFVL